MFFSKKTTNNFTSSTYVCSSAIANGHLDAQASHLAQLPHQGLEGKIKKKKQVPSEFFGVLSSILPKKSNPTKNFEKKHMCAFGGCPLNDFEIVRITKTRVLKIKHVDLYENYLGL